MKLLNIPLQFAVRTSRDVRKYSKIRRNGFGAQKTIKEATLKKLRSAISVNTPAAAFGTILEEIGNHLPVILFSPRQNSGLIHIGIRVVDLLAFHAYLTTICGRSLFWANQNDLELDLNNYYDVVVAMKSKYILASFEESRGEAYFRISLYNDFTDSFFTSDEDNIYARKIYKNDGEGALSKPGITHVNDILSAEHQTRQNFKIDVVFTWVNHDDENWRKLYQKHKASTTSNTDSQESARFINRDELKYSLRSILKYLPWVNNIHILSNCAPPDWLNVDHPRIRWVHHENIMDEKYLPTFSSHCIETYLHHVRDLTEHFLYFNDDFFVNRFLPPETFFLSNGLSVPNLEEYGMVNGPVEIGAPDYVNGARNGAQLIKDKFSVVPTQLHKHAPYALRKSVLQEMEKEFEPAVSRTRATKFRHHTDISMVSFLYHHYAFETGKAAPQNHETILVKASSGRIEALLELLEESSHVETFCLNDGEESGDDAHWDMRIKLFLQNRFPDKCELELVDQISIADN